MATKTIRKKPKPTQPRPASRPDRQRSVEVVRGLAERRAGARLAHGAEAVAKAAGGPPVTPDHERALGFIASLFRASFLVAACDGELSPGEARQLFETMSSVTHGLVSVETVEAMITESLRELVEKGFEAAIAAVGEAVDDEQDREAVFSVAVGISSVDGHVDDEELDILGALAGALRIPSARAQVLANDVFRSIAPPHT